MSYNNHNNDASFDFFSGGGPAAAKFPTIGTTVSGTIIGDAEMQQQTEPDGTPKVWKDGNPMMQLVVQLQTTDRDPNIDEDDGKRRLFIKGQMRNAVQQALIKAGKRGFEKGATLSVTYTHDGEKSNPAFNAPKQFSAVYTPPASDGSDFFGTAATDSDMPPGMDAAVWNDLPAEVRASLKSAAAVKA